MADSSNDGNANSPVEIEIEESGAENQQPPVNNQSGNGKKMKWTDRIRNLFSFRSSATTDTRYGSDVNFGSRQTSLMNFDGINDKKTIANGLMDFAFLTANANQLHNAVTSSSESSERSISIALISISITIQVIAGILLIVGSYIQSKLNTKEEEPKINVQLSLARLNFINHLTIFLVFLVAIINIFIAAFATGTSGSSTTTETTPTQTTSTTTAAAAFILKKFF